MAPIAMAIPIAASGHENADAGHADFHADARADDHRRTFVTNAMAERPAMPANAAAAASIGLINSFGNLGGFFGPYILGLLSDQSGGFASGLLYVSACSFAAGLLILPIRGVLRRRAADEYKIEEELTAGRVG